MITYFGERVHRRRSHSISKEISIRDSDLYKNNPPPPLFYGMFSSIRTFCWTTTSQHSHYAGMWWFRYISVFLFQRKLCCHIRHLKKNRRNKISDTSPAIQQCIALATLVTWCSAGVWYLPVIRGLVFWSSTVNPQLNLKFLILSR